MSISKSTPTKKPFQPFPLAEDAPRWQEIGEQFSDDDDAKAVEWHINQFDRSALDEASRHQCDPVHCRGCLLSAMCLHPNAASRTIERLEGQELLDAQRTKMADSEVQSRYTCMARESRSLSPTSNAIAN